MSLRRISVLFAHLISTRSLMSFPLGAITGRFLYGLGLFVMVSFVLSFKSFTLFFFHILVQTKLKHLFWLMDATYLSRSI